MPGIPREATTAAVDEVMRRRGLTSDHSRAWALPIVTDALEAAAPLMAETVAQKILAHMDDWMPMSRLGRIRHRNRAPSGGTSAPPRRPGCWPGPWSVGKITAQLAEEAGQVTFPQDLGWIATAFARAEDRLAPEALYAFRMAAVPGAQVSAAAAAALLAMPADRAQAALESLTDAHLLEPLPSGDYRYHRLVRAFARRQALAEYGHAACHAALHRLTGFYAARGAARFLHGDSPPEPGIAGTMTPAPAGR